MDALVKAAQRRRRPRDLAIFQIFRYSGMRRESVATLRVRNLDRQSGLRNVAVKGGKTRDIPLPAAVTQHLDRYVAEYLPTEADTIKSDTSLFWSTFRRSSVVLLGLGALGLGFGSRRLRRRSWSRSFSNRPSHRHPRRLLYRLPRRRAAPEAISRSHHVAVELTHAPAPLPYFFSESRNPWRSMPTTITPMPRQLSSQGAECGRVRFDTKERERSDQEWTAAVSHLMSRSDAVPFSAGLPSEDVLSRGRSSPFRAFSSRTTAMRFFRHVQWNGTPWSLVGDSTGSWHHAHQEKL
jgi:hypothetical protein